MAQPHQVEVVTQALDAFLEPRAPRRLEGEEAAARLRSALASEQDLPRPADEDAPHRILVMWRLARATARLTGICAEDEALDAATEIVPSPWHVGIVPKLTPSQQAVLRRASAADLIALFVGKPKDEGGLPLLPPSEPEKARRWCEAMSLLAGDLGIERTEEGCAGLRGLLHHKTCAMAGVSETNVLAIEELLVDEAQKLIVECGERPTIEHFRSRYGFARKEAIGLVRLARADALATGGSSVEEDRALMIAQLKDLIARAKEEMNTDRELKALKQLAAIQGLTRTEPEDQARDFMNVIARVAQQQDRVIDMPKSKKLAAGSEVVEYTVVEADTTLPYDEDKEDLALHDQENNQ